MEIRQAILDDAQAISTLFRAGIERWQRLDDRGQVEDLPYEKLSIYERWLHGGAWMSVETSAIQLSHLLSGAGLPYVAVQEDSVIGYAEAYLSDEPEPHGTHLHIRHILAGSGAPEETLDALMRHLLSVAETTGRITAATMTYDQERRAFFQRYGLAEKDQVQQFVTPVQGGGSVGFYKVSDHTNPDPEQIEGWLMPIGRTESAHYHWETFWPNLWRAVPQILERSVHRVRFNAAGQDAFVCSQQQLYNPRGAEIYCWTPKPLSSQLMNAIRDWAYKVGYRTITVSVSERIAPILGSQVEKTPHQQTILARDV